MNNYQDHAETHGIEPSENSISSRALLSCPFCGGEPEKTWDHRDCPIIQCEYCSAQTVGCETHERASEMWNERQDNAEVSQAAFLSKDLLENELRELTKIAASIAIRKGMPCDTDDWDFPKTTPKIVMHQIHDTYVATDAQCAYWSSQMSELLKSIGKKLSSNAELCNRSETEV